MVMGTLARFQAGRSPLLSQPLQPPHHIRSDQSSKRGLMNQRSSRHYKAETLTLTLTLTLTPTLNLTLTLTLTLLQANVLEGALVPRRHRHRNGQGQGLAAAELRTETNQTDRGICYSEPDVLFIRRTYR